MLCGLVSEIKFAAVGWGLEGLKGLNSSPLVLAADFPWVLCELVSEIKLIAVGRGLKGLKGLNGSRSVLVADVFRMLSET